MAQTQPHPAPLPLQAPAPRGVYELGWYAIDGVSVVLIAVDSEHRCIAYDRVTTPEAYAKALRLLTDALNARDPVPLHLVP